MVSNCEFVTFQLYPGSGVVLDCIDSRSLHSYLLGRKKTLLFKTIFQDEYLNQPLKRQSFHNIRYLFTVAEIIGYLINKFLRLSEK